MTQPISFICGNAKSIMYNRFCIEALDNMLISTKDMHALSKTLSEKLGEIVKPPYEDIFNHRLSCVIKNAVQYASVNSEYGNIRTRAQADTVEWLSGKLITNLYTLSLDYHNKNFEVVYNL